MRKLKKKSPEPRVAERDSLGGGKVDIVDGGLFKTREPCYVGVDASLTHFAISAVNEKGAHFTWVFRPKVTSPMTTPQQIRRLLDLGVFIHNTLDTLKLQTRLVRRVALEGYAYGAKLNREALGEGTAIFKVELVRSFGWANEVSYPIIIPSLNVKKFATDNTRASKDEMIAGVKKKWGVSFKDDNAADAFTLAMAAKTMYSGSAQLSYEADALKNIERHYPEWQQTKKKLSRSNRKTPTKSTRMRMGLSESPVKRIPKRLHRR